MTDKIGETIRVIDAILGPQKHTHKYQSKISPKIDLSVRKLVERAYKGKQQKIGTTVDIKA